MVYCSVRLNDISPIHVSRLSGSALNQTVLMIF